VIVDMTQKNPDNRLSIRDYLAILTCAPSPGSKLTEQGPDSGRLEGHMQGSADGDRGRSSSPPHSVLSGVPLFFNDVLYPLSVQLHWEGVTADDKVAIICKVSFYSPLSSALILISQA